LEAETGSWRLKPEVGGHKRSKQNERISQEVQVILTFIPENFQAKRTDYPRNPSNYQLKERREGSSGSWRTKQEVGGQKPEVGGHKTKTNGFRKKSK
jgi:hypothetical protein